MCARNFPGRKLGVVHLDYEAQYSQTTEYVAARLAEDSDISQKCIIAVCLLKLRHAHQCIGHIGARGKNPGKSYG